MIINRNTSVASRGKFNWAPKVPTMACAVLAMMLSVSASAQNVPPPMLSDDELAEQIAKQMEQRKSEDQKLREAERTDRNDPDIDRPASDKARQRDPADKREQSRPQDKQEPGRPQDKDANIPVTRPDQRVLRENPYVGENGVFKNLRSLEDLYAQSKGPRRPLERFGARLFRLGTESTARLQPLPDLPVARGYALGFGDVVEVTLSGSLSERLTRRIDAEGRINLPEVGNVMLAGMSLEEAQRTVQAQLDRNLNAVKADLSINRVRNIRVYVVGDVVSPGAYDISALSTPLSAILAAGGPTEQGSMRIVRQYRGSRLIAEVDLYQLLLKGVFNGMDRLESGDSLLIPPVGPEIHVDGGVRRPAIYELHTEKNLDDVLKLAGGVRVTGSYSHIQIDRVEAHANRTTARFEMPKEPGKTLDETLRRFEVQDGDQVMVAWINPFSDQTIYVDGHVYQPGRYPYRQGLKIVDILRPEDFLPEPAQRAEVVRLRMPDLSPTIITFQLQEAMSGALQMELQPFDTIRIFGRYEFDAPRVKVLGEVMRPGEYPMAQGMTVADLIRLAGGFSRGAYTVDADLVSHVVEMGRDIVSSRSVVDLQTVMEAGSKANPALSPGDVLTIKQIAGFRDIGAAVHLRGEFVFPGSYGIEDGERLSSVVQRAGGLRPGAYPQGAVLEQVLVREHSQRSKDELMNRLEFEAIASTTFSADTPDAVKEETNRRVASQRAQLLERLRSQPVSGRLVVNITADVSTWKGTEADILLRAGDVLVIPKRPTFVIVAGQVYNQAALTFQENRTASWYLRRSGGVTEFANLKRAYIVQTNGTVIGRDTGWWKRDLLASEMRPGDMLVIPERVIGTSRWKNLAEAAQILTSISLAAAVTSRF